MKFKRNFEKKLTFEKNRMTSARMFYWTEILSGNSLKAVLTSPEKWISWGINGSRWG